MAAQTWTRYSFNVTVSPPGFSTRAYRENTSNAGPRQAKIASAPTTPSSANRGIQSWMRFGSSANTSRQSPTSSFRNEPSAVLAGTTDEMN